jgi:hypothetical protein
MGHAAARPMRDDDLGTTASPPEPQPTRRRPAAEAPPLNLDQIERDLGKEQRHAIEEARARAAELGKGRMGTPKVRQPRKEPQC